MQQQLPRLRQSGSTAVTSRRKRPSSMQPIARVRRQRSIDFLAQTLCQRRAFARSRNRDLQLATPHHARKVVIADTADRPRHCKEYSPAFASAYTARFTSAVAVPATTARNAPARSPARYSRCSQTSSPLAAHSCTRGNASGAITITLASARSRLSIFDSAILPAPMTTQGLAASFRKMGNKLFVPLTPTIRYQNSVS